MPIVQQDSDQTKSRLKLGWGIAVSSPCLGNSAACPIPRAGQAHARTLCSSGLLPRGSISTRAHFGVIFLKFSHMSLSRRPRLAQISPLMRTVLTPASLVPSEPWEVCLFLNHAGLFAAASSCHPARLLQSSR